MESTLSTLAFALLIGAQFLAAIVLISRRKAIYGELENPKGRSIRHLNRCRVRLRSRNAQRKLRSPRLGAQCPISQPTEPSVELAHIRYFVALCEERSFTRAARRCGISQPSLSNAIKALEHELGGKLFERSGMSLTPLGKSLRPQFESALASVGQITKRATAFHRRQAYRASHRLWQQRLNSAFL